MSDFKPINSQEELDAVIKDRLARESKKYADYDELKKGASEKDERIKTLEAQLKEQSGAVAKYAEQLKGVEEKDKELEALKGQVKSHEINSLKYKIAHEEGLPTSFHQGYRAKTRRRSRKTRRPLRQFSAIQPRPLPTYQGNRLAK